MNDPQSDKPAARSASAVRRAQAREDLRAKILAAAAALFVEQGYEGLSLRRLAEQIGYTAPTIYLYFANKDALLFALLDEGYNQLGAHLAEAAAAHAEPLARLEAIGRAYIAFGRAHPQHYQLMFMRRADFLQARLAARPGAGDPFAVLQGAVAQAIAAGALPPGDMLSYNLALWSAVHGLVGLLLIGPPLTEEQTQQIITTTARAVLDGLRQPERSRSNDETA